MALTERARRMPPLGVFRMAAGLVAAAFTGAALGLVWQSSGLGDPDPEDEVAGTADPAKEARPAEPAAPEPSASATIPQSG